MENQKKNKNKYNMSWFKQINLMNLNYLKGMKILILMKTIKK